MTVRAVVHSVEDVQDVELLKKTGDNQYLVKTTSGVTCTAIFNPFVGLYYADDLYGVVKTGENTVNHSENERNHSDS